MAHTYMAYIREYLPGSQASPTLWFVHQFPSGVGPWANQGNALEKQGYGLVSLSLGMRYFSTLF